MPSNQELQSYCDKLLNYNTSLKHSGSTIRISSDLTYFRLNFRNAGNKVLELDFMKYTNSIIPLVFKSLGQAWTSLAKTKTTSKSCSAEVISFFKERWYIQSLYKTLRYFFFLKQSTSQRRMKIFFFFFYFFYWLLGRLIFSKHFTSSDSTEKKLQSPPPRRK